MESFCIPETQSNDVSFMELLKDVSWELMSQMGMEHTVHSDNKHSNIVMLEMAFANFSL